MSEESREYYVGKQVTALMEEAYEFEGETYFTGYTKEYVKIAVKSAADLSNQFVKGTIRGRLTDDIYLMVEFQDKLYQNKLEDYCNYEGTE